ncbi:MAG: AEC family transporter [Verrucomicrobiota bacterium]
MNEFKTVLLAVLPVFGIAVAGIFMRKWNWLTEEADKSLLRVTVNVLAPCLIFSSILQNQALKQINNLLLAPAVGFGTVALGMGVAFALNKISGLRERKAISTFIVCVGLYNYGYISVPLANSLFDRETIGVLFVHNIGVEIALWTLVIMTLSGNSAGTWKNIFNPPVLAVILTVPLNFLHGDQWIPSFVLIAVKMLGECAIPMGIILVGATMADHLHEFHSASGWRVISSMCVLRAGLMPILFLLLAKFLLCSIELKRVIVLQSAMPTATFAIVMARHYGGDAATALRAVIATSVIGLLTIPLWIRFGIKFVGL